MQQKFKSYEIMGNKKEIDCIYAKGVYHIYKTFSLEKIHKNNII